MDLSLPNAPIAPPRGAAHAATHPGGSTRSAAGDGPEEAARSFIATALIQPVLKQLRATNSAAEPFGPGAFEKQFAPLMDQMWAEQLVRASHWPLVDSVARRLREASGEPVDRALPSSAPSPSRDAASSAGRSSPEGLRSLIHRRGWLG
ncbi:MAG: hypothetical protein ACTS3F_10625 [Phycisphaerales bacterium]